MRCADVHVQRSQESGKGNAENGLVKIMTFFSNPHGRIDPCNKLQTIICQVITQYFVITIII